MKKFKSAELTKRPGQSFTWETAKGTSLGLLEVNVIFTNMEATAAALSATESFARDLGARIRLRAGIVVPVQLPLDQPLVSVNFFEQALRKLMHSSESDEFERTIHLYICRDWNDTLVEVLKPDSVVVIGFRKRRWPTAESRLARALRAKGIRVMLVDTRRKPAMTPRPRRDMLVRLLARRVGAWPEMQSPVTREVD
ncbi:MAG: hypothetical protein WBQ34_01545 [Candidatus Acidiferrales bacterium]